MAHGAKWVETDVQFTKDNVPVIMHDDTVDRTTDGTGAVRDLTYVQIRTLRTPDNQPVPTLDELLSDVKTAKRQTFVELKTVPSAAQWTAFNAPFTKWGMKSQAVVTSFDKTVLPTAKAKGYTTGWIDELGDRSPTEVTPYATYYLKHHWSVTYDRYQKWTAAGLKVYPWTVNQSADESRFATLKVPGVITDKPNTYACAV
jgi:glycerophosphoryl diester phosphodiesterase